MVGESLDRRPRATGQSGRLQRGRTYARRVRWSRSTPRDRVEAVQGSRQAVSRDDQVSKIERCGVGAHHRRDGQRGAVRRTFAEWRDAGADRGRVRRGWHQPVSTRRRRHANKLLMSGLGQSVQAYRRGALSARRAIRRRPVPDVLVARTKSGRHYHGAPRASYCLQRRLRTRMSSNLPPTPYHLLSFWSIPPHTERSRCTSPCLRRTRWR